MPPCGSMGHEVAEARGRLYRSRGDGRYDTCRAVRGRPGIACHGAFAQSYGLGCAWWRAGRDEALFAPSWDVWWSDYAESKGFNDVVVGVYDHMPLGSDIVRLHRPVSRSINRTTNEGTRLRGFTRFDLG